MCAGYELAADPEAIGRAFRIEDLQLELPDAAPRAATLSLFDEPEPARALERFPRQQGVIVLQRGSGQRAAGLARFGLIPAQARTPDEGDKLYNARAETVHERVTFREAFMRRRCLVPVTAFFEWQKQADGRARRYAFRPHSGGLLTLGGIWQTWRSPDGQKLGSFAILTTAPNALVAPIHTRMPVILPAEAHDVWLDPRSDFATLQRLMEPAPDALLAALPG